MALKNGKQLKQMLRLGWALVDATPTITLSNFRTDLEATTQFTRQDWNVGVDVLEELGYFPKDETWVNIRTWLAGTVDKIRRAILDAAEAFYAVSPAAQTDLLTDQRVAIVVRRNELRDSIQDALLPFRDSPPPGVDSRVVDAVNEQIKSQRAARDVLNEQVAVLDARLLELADDLLVVTPPPEEDPPPEGGKGGPTPL